MGVEYMYVRGRGEEDERGRKRERESGWEELKEASSRKAAREMIIPPLNCLEEIQLMSPVIHVTLYFRIPFSFFFLSNIVFSVVL